MRQTDSIILISCYEMGHQPLGLASPLGFLERAGYGATAIDLAVEAFDTTRVAQAGFVGISVPMHTALRLGIRIAERVRAVNPSCHLCFYGLYATLNAHYLFEHGADSVIGGEYEEPLVALVASLRSGQHAPVDGVRMAGQLGGGHLQRLSFPAPRRMGLPPLDRYARLAYGGTEQQVGYVEASRGCLHLCLHCPIPPVYGGRFFVVPKEVVLEDVRGLLAAGARHISFGDPDFLNGPGHSLRITTMMHEEFPDLSFDFTAKVEHLLQHRALLPRFRDLGCLFIVSAFESISDTVLGRLAKGHTRADLEEALRLSEAAGVALRPTWVAFTPWTTLVEYLEWLEWIERNRLAGHIDPVQYAIRLLVPPGSSLLDRQDIHSYLEGLDEAALTYRWRHPDRRMDALQRDLAALIEACAGMDASLVFARVRRQAFQVAGLGEPAAISTVGATRSVPRLTESWFC